MQVRGRFDEALVMGGDQQTVPPLAEHRKPSAKHRYRVVVKAGGRFVEQNEARLFACKSRKEGRKHGDFPHLALRKVSDQVFCSVVEFEGFKERTDVHARTAHRASRVEVVFHHFASKDTVFLQR